MADENRTLTETDVQSIAKAFAQEIGQVILQAQAVNQQAGAASTLSELVNKLASSSSRDTDVSEEEAMKSFAPVWPLNAKLIFANELAGAINARALHDNVAIQKAFDDLSDARRWAVQAYSAFGERNTLNLKVLSDTVGRRALEE